MDERTEQRLLTGDLAAGEHDTGVQLFHVVRAVIGQRVALEIRPAVFVRVEFRSVAGQVFQVKPAASPQPQSQHSTTMSCQPVPDHDDGAVEVCQQIAQKVDDLFLPDGPVQVEAQIPPQSAALWRNREPADCRDPAVVSCALSHDRGLSAKSPRPAHQRGQQEARFIDENQMRLAASGQSLDPRPVFLDPRSDRPLVAFSRLAFGFLWG